MDIYHLQICVVSKEDEANQGDNFRPFLDCALHSVK